jgi:hypothetical protein
LRFQPDEDDRKRIAAAAAQAASGAASGASVAAPAAAEDDGVLSNTRGGERVYRVWTVGAGKEQVPQPHEVTVGISNTRYTELAEVLSGALRAGDALITRRAETPGGR